MKVGPSPGPYPPHPLVLAGCGHRAERNDLTTQASDTAVPVRLHMARNPAWHVIQQSRARYLDQKLLRRATQSARCLTIAEARGLEFTVRYVGCWLLDCIGNRRMSIPCLAMDIFSPRAGVHAYTPQITGSHPQASTSSYRKDE
jgi:hypothetical protein